MGCVRTRLRPPAGKLPSMDCLIWAVCGLGSALLQQASPPKLSKLRSCSSPLAVNTSPSSNVALVPYRPTLAAHQELAAMEHTFRFSAREVGKVGEETCASMGAEVRCPSSNPTWLAHVCLTSVPE